VLCVGAPLDTALDADDGQIVQVDPAAGIVTADCTVEHGSSGGPMLDADGKVIGVVDWLLPAGGVRSQLAGSPLLAGYWEKVLKIRWAAVDGSAKWQHGSGIAVAPGDQLSILAVGRWCVMGSRAGFLCPTGAGIPGDMLAFVAAPVYEHRVAHEFSVASLLVAVGETTYSLDELPPNLDVGFTGHVTGAAAAKHVVVRGSGSSKLQFRPNTDAGRQLLSGSLDVLVAVRSPRP
jgi:hypothetical protein